MHGAKQTLQNNVHTLSGIRTHYPKKNQTSPDLCFRPQGQWDRSFKPEIDVVKSTGYVMHQQFNLLNPTGHATHQQFNIQQLYVLPTLYLCVLCLRENKQRLVALIS